MSKRGALTDLNHDNWDQQEEDEEVGTFARASDKDLSKRVIKKAARRLESGGESGVKSVFGGFSGFGKIETKPPAVTFSFLNNVAASVAPAAAPVQKPAEPVMTTPQKTITNGGGITYSADLKELNLSFVKWVKECVDKNALCILTPVFDDYRKYLKELEDEKAKQKEVTVVPPKVAPELPASAATFKFGTLPTQPEKPSTIIEATKKNDEKEKPTTFTSFASTKIDPTPKIDSGAATGFSFGTSTKIATTPNPTPTFGNVTKPFSFGASSTPFSFGNVTQPPRSADDGGTAKKDAEEAENEDEPPKVEFTPVVEEDSVYNKRCKVFVKQGEEYKDRGVGTLYIKLVEDGKKTQVIVRANTNLGNLLLNTLLGTSIPTKRMGKNNVMIATVVDGKPTPVLLRVKTPEDADELLAELEKHKK